MAMVLKQADATRSRAIAAGMGVWRRHNFRGGLSKSFNIMESEPSAGDRSTVSSPMRYSRCRWRMADVRRQRADRPFLPRSDCIAVGARFIPLCRPWEPRERHTQSDIELLSVVPALPVTGRDRPRQTGEFMARERRTMRPATLIAVALTLSSCVSREELLRRDRLTCAEIGFAPGSAQYTNCVLELQSSRLSDHHGRR